MMCDYYLVVPVFNASCLDVEWDVLGQWDHLRASRAELLDLFGKTNRRAY